jgi:hypothetical protein
VVFNLDVKRVLWAGATKVITQGIVFLLSFADFGDAELASDGRFTLIFTGVVEVLTCSTLFFSRAYGHFGTVFPTESTFLFFKTSVEIGVEQGP